MEDKDREVFLVSTGSKKLEVIKVIRHYTDIGLKEAKELEESAPCTVWSGIAEDVAGNMKRDLENAGATAEVRIGSGIGAGERKSDSEPRYVVTIYDPGPKIIEIIKIVRDYTDLGLKEAKELVESAPGAAVPRLTEEAAGNLKRDLERVGATAEIRNDSAFGWTTKDSDKMPGYSVFLNDPGPEKIEVIKVVRHYTGLGLKEAKELVESAPATVSSGISRQAAENMWQELVRVGATGEVRNT